MIKKIIYTTTSLFFLIFLAIWSPWDKYNISIARLFDIDEIEQSSGFEIFSLNGELEVYIDGELKDTVLPEDGSIVIDDIEPGRYIVKLSRKSNPENLYYEVIKSINFIESINVVAAYELGPTKDFSQGHIFYARKNLIGITDSARLNIITDIENVEIFLDDISIGESPINNFELDMEDIHIVRFEKKGYEPLEFSILPEDQEERDKLKGLDLFIEADLFLIPLDKE